MRAGARVLAVLGAAVLFFALPLLLCRPGAGTARPTPAPDAAQSLVGWGSAATDQTEAGQGSAAPAKTQTQTQTQEQPQEQAPAPTPTPAGNSHSAGQAAPYRAVWVSYLEWQQMDFSTSAAFTAAVRGMVQNMAAAGCTVVLAQVRPFGDALYPSAYYPYSHLCTGAQGQDPGFDPLAILLAEAHAAGLELEAWLNPYRLQAGSVPSALCAANLANTHPEWVKTTGNGLYLNPASAAVRQYIAASITELCQNYPLDGIHFDDYFYPTTDPAFDAADYAASGTALPLDAWRRQNVNELVALCCAAAHRCGVRFGIAPQGDLELNYTAQYSDAALWLAAPGYVDYLMPQLYWGLAYTKNGSTAHALGTLAAQWAALPRAQGVALYAGLGAYRIGTGDGGDGTAAEWTGGHALADQVAALQELGIPGVGLYRYASLWGPDAAPQAAGELAALGW